MNVSLYVSFKAQALYVSFRLKTLSFEYLHLESISDSAIFAPKSRCSPKKKKKSLHRESISDSTIFAQNQGVLQKKKKRSSSRIDL